MTIIRKKYGKWLLLFVLSAVFSCRQTPKINDTIVAVVGDYSIPFNTYRQRYKDYLGSTQIKDNLRSRRLVLENMVREILLKNYDDNTSITKNPEFQKELDWAKNEMILAYLKDQEVYSRIKVSDAERRQAFVRMNEKIAARHLYAATAEEADRLYQRLQHGADFNVLARETFTDSLLQNNGGYLGYFSWGDMDPAFEAAAYSLQPGQISKPVKTAQGFSIIKVEDRKANPILTEAMFENKKNQLTRLIKISKKAASEQAFIRKYFKADEVRVNSLALEPLVKLLQEPEEASKETVAGRMANRCISYRDQTYSCLSIFKMLQRVPERYLGKIENVQQLQQLIVGLFGQQELLRVAKAKGYESAQPVQKAIANSRNNLYLKFKRRETLKQIFVPDSTLRKYYQDHINEFQQEPEINVREILLENHTQALKIKSQILHGMDFAKLAQSHSLRRWSAGRGGEIGLSKLSRFGNMKEKLWKAEVGQLLGPVQAGSYWGIFQVIEKVSARPAPFEQVKGELRQDYLTEHQTELIGDYIDRLRQDVTVTLNNKKIKEFVLP